MMYTIYKYTSKSTGKSYVGKTSKTLNQRAGNNGNCYKACTYFYGAIREYGWDDFTCEVVDATESPVEACKLEIENIIKFNTVYPSGYNSPSTVSKVKQLDYSEKLDYIDNMNIERDTQIYNDYKSGKKMVELAKDYKLSIGRIQQIVVYQKQLNKDEDLEVDTRSTREMILEDYQNGAKPSEIAAHYQVSRQYVYKLISNMKPEIVDTNEVIENLKAQIHGLEEENDRLKRIIDRLLSN